MVDTNAVGVVSGLQTVEERKRRWMEVSPNKCALNMELQCSLSSDQLCVPLVEEEETVFEGRSE